jgi:hypothetical protein
MITCSTSCGCTPARCKAAAIANPPSSAALKEASAPLIFPIGVRAPAMIYEPGMGISVGEYSHVSLMDQTREPLRRSHRLIAG